LLLLLACNHATLQESCSCEPVTLASGLEDPGAIVVDQTYAYWVERYELKRVPLGGGKVESLSPQSGYALGQDADWLYFGGTKNIGGLPKAGGEVKVLGQGTSQYSPSLSVDEDAIYWVDPGDLSPASNGRIMRACLSDGPQTPRVEGLFEPYDLARPCDDVVF